jgi:hypothetical protein
MRLLRAPVPSDDDVVLEFGSNTVGWARAWTAFFGLFWIGIGVGRPSIARRA